VRRQTIDRCPRIVVPIRRPARLATHDGTVCTDLWASDHERLPFDVLSGGGDKCFVPAGTINSQPGKREMNAKAIAARSEVDHETSGYSFARPTRTASPCASGEGGPDAADPDP
jgi:hypothetical protein